VKVYAVLLVKGSNTWKNLYSMSRGKTFAALFIGGTAESECKMASDERNVGGKFLGPE
jgi:hypothetical protein